MSNWFFKYRHNPNADLRVFCFPYAGGSAVVFDGWQHEFPDNIDVMAIQAPGRGNRFSEPAIGSLNDKVDSLFEEIIPFLDIPYVFVGHSNGALTAFELSRKIQSWSDAGKLTAQAQKNYRHLIISAKRAPFLPKIKPDMAHLPLDDFIERLREYNGTPKEILENKELMELFYPMLKADFSLSENMQYQEGQKLRVPATLFWGQQDVDVPKEDMQQWEACFEQPLPLIPFSDDHFFINSQREAFIGQVNKIVENCLENINA